MYRYAKSTYSTDPNAVAHAKNTLPISHFALFPQEANLKYHPSPSLSPTTHTFPTPSGSFSGSADCCEILFD